MSLTPIPTIPMTMRLLLTCIALTLCGTAPLAAQESTEANPVSAWYTIGTESGPIDVRGHTLEITTVMGDDFSLLDVDGETMEIDLFQDMFYAGMAEKPEPESASETHSSSNGSTKTEHADGSTTEVQVNKEAHANADGSTTSGTRTKSTHTNADGSTTTVLIIVTTTTPPTIR